MFPKIIDTIQPIERNAIQADRLVLLQPLIEFIQKKTTAGEKINLNFICTHNSRRSHLAQIWAQVAASHYQIPNVCCYSGGTEATALFPMIATTLVNQGFQMLKLADGANPIYAIKYSENESPIVGFSKNYAHPYNPANHFAAIMTCSQADHGCPFVAGAATRIPITYEDPKASDGNANQASVYFDKSLEIAKEMLYVFSKITR